MMENDIHYHSTTDEEKAEGIRHISTLIEQSLTKLVEQSREQGRGDREKDKHVRGLPVFYVSSGILLTLIVLVVQLAYNYGTLTTRVTALESKTQGIEVVGVKLDSLQNEVRRFMDRYEGEKGQKK